MKVTKTKPASNQEKRHYFRIEDHSILHYRVLSGEDDLSIYNRPKQKWGDNLSLRTELGVISREAQPLMRVLEAQSPNLAACLASVNKKLDLLANSLINDAIDDMDSCPQKVNIGAGGLSFISDKPIMTGSFLELRLILLPDNTGILTYARVVSCKRYNDDMRPKQAAFSISIEFVRMTDAERDLISRHVLRKEQASLGASH